MYDKQCSQARAIYNTCTHKKIEVEHVPPELIEALEKLLKGIKEHNGGYAKSISISLAAKSNASNASSCI